MFSREWDELLATLLAQDGTGDNERSGWCVEESVGKSLWLVVVVSEVASVLSRLLVARVLAKLLASSHKINNALAANRWPWR